MVRCFIILTLPYLRLARRSLMRYTIKQASLVLQEPFNHEHRQLDRIHWCNHHPSGVFLYELPLDVGTRTYFFPDEYCWLSPYLFFFLACCLLAILCIGRNLGACFIGGIFKGWK